MRKIKTLFCNDEDDIDDEVNNFIKDNNYKLINTSVNIMPTKYNFWQYNHEMSIGSIQCIITVVYDTEGDNTNV